jgi:toxin FitB
VTYLVDANVLSEATRPDPNPAVIEWLRRHESDIAVDPVILGELRFGILLLSAGKRRARLEAWFEQAVKRIHCLPWDAETGLQWAALLARLRRSGQSMPIKDSFIAASAIASRRVMVTRDVRDFRQAGLEVLNPFVR